MITNIFAASECFFIPYSVWKLLHAYFDRDPKQIKFWVRNLIVEILQFAVLLWLMYINK